MRTTGARTVIAVMLAASCAFADLMFDSEGNLLDDGLAGKSGAR
jgi:hypothetical protein